jgi:hypothetical protein
MHKYLQLMIMTIGELRSLIREASSDCWGSSRPEEMYEQELVNDESWNKKSVYVPDEIKEPIRKWMKAMHLSGHKKHVRSS